jgi:serine/threonine protein phosphatase PrpC
MEAYLDYPSESDQLVYRRGSIQSSQYIIEITAATIAGSVIKANEDAFAVVSSGETLIAAVFDGTTSLKPIKALGSQSGARFASHHLKDYINTLNVDDAPEDILLTMNHSLLAASTALGGTLADTHSLPSSLATLLEFTLGTDQVTFAHVGDSFGILFYTDGRSVVFTNDTNKKFDASMFDLISKVAKDKSVSPRLARDDITIKQALIAMFVRRNNNPDGTGSGMLNGDPNLNLYIQTGTFALEGVAAILIGSDGLLPPGWSLDNASDRDKMRAAIEAGGFQELFNLKHAAEDADPEWHHVRYKHSDDATGILIKCSPIDQAS